MPTRRVALLLLLLLVAASLVAAGCTSDRDVAESPVEGRSPINVVVPDVVGMRVQPARQALVDEGFAVSIHTDGLQSAPATVLTQSIPPGTEVPPGSTIRLTIESPGQAKFVVVPDVEGMMLQRARAILHEEGLVVSVRSRNSQVEAETVLKQSFPPGTELSAGARVRLTVAE
jgi:beta-lactam-binding protein with PASTA domain